MRRRVSRLQEGSSQEEADGRQELKPAQGWSESKLLLGCIAFRILNALLIQTSFNPDEYWQSLEVAHRIVFGYGHLTWEWTRGIRSYTHPLIFGGLYKCLELTKMDTRWLVMKAPRLLQALITAAGDLYLFRLSRLYWGDHAAKWTIFCQFCNWFIFFCMVRTFSNCLETVLTVAALYYWVIGKKISDLRCLGIFTARQVALFLAAFACVVRPTTAIIWVYLGLIDLLKTNKKLRLLSEVLVIGVSTLGGSCLIDRWMYGRWVFVPLNFLKFNFLASGGDYYGTHPWHWYFSQGFPAMILTFMPLLLLGIWWSKQWQVAGLIGWVLALYSFLGHKEFRFVLPVLPLALMFAGYALASMQQSGDVPDSTSGSIKTISPTKFTEKKMDYKTIGISNASIKPIWFRAVVVGLLATNIPTALYTSLVHQRGSEAVMHFISKEIASGHAKSVMFLTPCHSTPYYSFLHANITMSFLDCSPSDEVGYIDESDRFLADPLSFVLGFYKNEQQLPSHLVFYDSMEHKLSPFLREHGYKQATRIFHAHLPVDHGFQNYILVFGLEH